MGDMKVLPLDYATKDYEGFMQMFKENIPVLTPEWTDMSESDQGIVILQLLAYALHIQSFNMDKGINENIIQLAKTKRAILLLSKFLGYEIKKQKPSKATITFTKTAEALDMEVTIPARTKVSTDPALGNPITFETDDYLAIPSGTSTATVAITQGESVLDYEVGVGNGEANQSYVINTLEILHDSIFLQTNENGASYSWTQVENFINSLPQDRHYLAEFNEDGETLIKFGDGVTGMRPPYNSVLEATFRYGGGTKGDMAVNKINFLVNPISGIASLTNEIASTGGVDYEDLEKVRDLAPKNYRTGGSAVTPDDFQDLAETFAGVGRAVCIETFNATNDVNLYLAPTDGSTITQELIDDVKAFIEDVMVMNQNLYVHEVQYYDYDLTLTVYANDNFSQSDVEYQVRSSLTDYLKSNNFKFGEEIFLGQISAQVFPIRGVRNVIITAPTVDITPGETQLPRLVNLNLTMQGGVI